MNHRNSFAAKKLARKVPVRYDTEFGCWIAEFGPCLGAGDTVGEAKRILKRSLSEFIGAYLDGTLAGPSRLEEAFDTIGEDIRVWKKSG